MSSGHTHDDVGGFNYNPGHWSQRDKFESIEDCMNGVKYAQLKYGTLSVTVCPGSDVLKTQYKKWLLFHGMHVPSDADLDPYNLPAWPDMRADVNSPGFVGSPEYVGMTTV